MYYVRTTNGGMMAITPRTTAVVAVKKNSAARVLAQSGNKIVKKS